MSAFNVTHAKYRGKPRWMVDGKLAGKRIRRFFQTRIEAEQDCRERNIECEKFGSRALPDNVRVQALTAHDMLEPLGITLIEAADFYIKGKSLAARSEKIEVIVQDFWLSTQNQVQKHETSEEHYRGLKKVGKRLQEAFGARLASDIQSHEIVRWLESLEGLTANSRDFYRRYAASIFAYAKSQGYVDVNPVHGIPSMARKAEIGILTAYEVEALLKNCHPSMIPFYALGCFAGLRPMSELLLLTWDKIHWEDRVIDVENVKTAGHANSARNRYVEMSDNLVAWLKNIATWPYSDPESDNILGKVVPGNWRDHVYGTKGEYRRRNIEASDRERAGIKHWPHDAMRHSFASYHLALHQDAAKLADQMGHSNSDLLYRHYRRKVKPEEAKRFWEIRP